MPSPDDERLGRLLRKLRRERGFTQEQLGAAAHVPVEDIGDIEAGRVGRVRTDRARAVVDALGGRLYLKPWWNGAAADRLLDEEHAAIVEIAAAVFKRRSWRTAIEVTFASFGERGSVDMLGGHELTRTVAVCEIKSAFGSLEETNRSLDVKVRLAPKICEATFGWRPRCVGRLLIVPEGPWIRRVVREHANTMDSLYPERSRAVRAWLSNPDRNLSGLWFLSN